MDNLDRALNELSELGDFLQERGAENLEENPPRALEDFVEAKRLHDLVMRLRAFHNAGHFEDYPS